MDGIRTFRTIVLLVILLGKLPSPGRALDPEDFAVQVTAQVQLTPPAITLQWPASNFATSFIVSRKLLEDQTWSRLATLTGATTAFTDRAVVAGAAYEYEVAQMNSDGVVGYGYIFSGMEVPFPAARGRVVLIVDASVASGLTNELARLSQDLVGDGWSVVRQDVPRTASSPEVKAVLQGFYRADPIQTKAVFLVGHVPVPYSGQINPDMHPNHLGAWPADSYYGDMDGAWTDISVNTKDSEDPRNHNVPGDGKFDQSNIPGTVVLQVGRVDLSDLPSFAPRSELDLLRQYFDKNHQFRHKLFSPERRGLLRDNFGEVNGDAPASDAWRNFPPFFGSDHIHVVGPGEFFPTLARGSYLFAYGCGGGEFYQADGVGSTQDFATQSPQAVFYMLDGSYFGDWDSTDNFLRAALASSGSGLTSAEMGLPHWFLHHMALGQPIGFSVLVTQNNRGLYRNRANLSAGQVHIALMGDPTLRMHMVAPPSNLIARSSGDQSVALTWTPSAESIRGYYVYRGDNLNGPFARLNRTFLLEPSFTDTSAPPGPKIYMVRAVKLETSSSGTYYNPSQGITASVDLGDNRALPVISLNVSDPDANEADGHVGSFVLTRSGPSKDALDISFTLGGSATNGLDYVSISSSLTLAPDSSAAWVSIKPLTDAEVEGDETVTLTLLPSPAYTVGSPGSATIRIHDAPPPAPQLPQISTIPDVTVTQNASSGPIPFTVSDPDTPLSQVQTTAMASDAALIPADGLRIDGTEGQRSLFITPAPNRTGTARVTINAADGSGQSQVSLEVTVQPASPTRGRITGIGRQSDGSPTLQFQGPAGSPFTVEGSKDFRSWDALGSGVFDPQGVSNFLDSAGLSSPRRFYRLSSP